MLKNAIKAAIRRLGYEIHRIEPQPATPGAPSVQKQSIRRPSNEPPAIEPIWPLPRRPGGPSDEEIRKEFARFDLWHYAYAFDGGLSFSVRHTDQDALADDTKRPLKRFRHFMPYLIDAENGSLKGKRVLDIACNSGFWSLQCALLGADVVGFDARPELVAQANLLKSIVGVQNVTFQQLDFWEMSPARLNGTYDIVLNLGILYHLPEPLAALKLTKQMSHRWILLDTEVYQCDETAVLLRWEEPFDIRMANEAGIVVFPSKSSIGLMAKHLGCASSQEIPLRSEDMPGDYLEHRRASWLIRV